MANLKPSLSGTWLPTVGRPGAVASRFASPPNKYRGQLIARKCLHRINDIHQGGWGNNAAR
jgi:hypothetical protein